MANAVECVAFIAAKSVVESFNCICASDANYCFVVVREPKES